MARHAVTLRQFSSPELVFSSAGHILHLRVLASGQNPVYSDSTVLARTSGLAACAEKV